MFQSNIVGLVEDFFEKVAGKPDNFDEIFAMFHQWDRLQSEKFIPVDFYLKKKEVVYFFSEYREKIASKVDFDRVSYEISFKKILERHDWTGFFGSKIFINSGKADNYNLTEIGKTFQSVFLVSGSATENELDFITSSLDFILKKFDEIRADYQTNYARLLIEKFINPLIDGSAESFGEANDFVKKWRNFQARWQELLINEEQMLINQEQDQEVSEESESESDQDFGLESESESDQEQGGQSEAVFPQSSSQFPVVQTAANPPQQSSANPFVQFPGTVFISPLYQAVSTNFPHRGSPYARHSGLVQSTTFKTPSGKVVGRYYRPHSCPNLGASRNTPGSDFFTRRNEVAAAGEVSEVTERVAQLRLEATSHGNAGLFSQTLRCESDNSSQRVAQFDASVPNSGGIR